MGYDEHKHSTSSGTMVGVLIAVFLVVGIAMLVLAGGALFWVRTAKLEAVAQREMAMAARHRAVVESQGIQMMQMESPDTPLTAAPQVIFTVQIDREGTVTVDSQAITLDELKARLVKLKEETSNTFKLRFHADPECPVKHLASVLELTDELGDIDYHVAARVAGEEDE